MITSSVQSLTKEQRLELFLKNNPKWSFQPVINEKLREKNKKLLTARAERLRYILKQRFKLRKTYSQIAARLKITPARVQQIAKKATENYVIE